MNFNMCCGARNPSCFFLEDFILLCRKQENQMTERTSFDHQTKVCGGKYLQLTTGKKQKEADISNESKLNTSGKWFKRG